MSRRALVSHLRGEMAANGSEAPGPGRRPRSSLLDGIEWAPVARKMARHWWQRHPANAVVQVALPVLERYAREQPFKLVTAAATVGALVVLTRPWKLLSSAAVATAVLKTSDVAGVLNTLMQRRTTSPRKEPK